MKIVEKNPAWLIDGACLTPAGVKKLFETAFDAGHQQGFRNGKAKAEMEFRDAQQKDDSLFGRIFGGH